MPLINSIINWFNVKRLYQMDLFKLYPHDVQQDTLLKNIKMAKDTWYGKKYGFKEIRTVKDFQERLPLHNYDTIKPYIDKQLKGEKNLLWPGEITWFAKSSGTTSDKSKFIPVSKECLEDNHFRGGRDVVVIYMSNNPNSQMLKGKTLTLGGSHQINKFNSQSLYGDLSAILIENIPFWTHFVRTPPSKIALMDKWEEKLEEVTKASLKENVTALSGVPSWNLILLKHILNVTGKQNILQIWPNMELFIHGGVAFTPYKEQFRKLIPSEGMQYLETYNASEGFFAIQDKPDRDDMLLILDSGIFFEFIPMTDFEKDNPTTLSIDEVELNKNYAIVISTNAGLWRYIIGDTVYFTSKYPHRIKISGRTKHFINAFGEELIIDNAEKGLREACRKTGAEITEYTAGPVYISEEKSGHHQWLIEFSVEPNDIDFFATTLDNALMALNSDYEAKRYKNITLAPLQIINLKKGTFYNWLESKNKLGGQNKVPRLANNRKYLEELLKFHQEN
jgi:hypothetical protein